MSDLPNPAPDSPREAGDAEIRRALRAHLRESSPDARVVDEVQIGASRVDVLAIGASLTAFEIKSWRDSLKRLDQQARDYSLVCGHAALVATVRHMDDAAAIVPSWWGLLLINDNGRGGITFSPLRPMEPNPAVSVAAVARLLWTEELRELLRHFNAIKGTSRLSKYHLAAALRNAGPLADVHAAIIDTLRARPEWRDENGRAINRLTSEEPAHV